jgi:23S rRNA (cytidine2498-2'-O)-methyltransferase
MGLHLHVFPREAPEDGLSLAEWKTVDERAAELRAALLAKGADLHEERAAREGEWVLDVVLDAAADGKFLAGVHRHTVETHPCAGALPRIQMPADVPSRAWLKMEQALVYAGLGDAVSLRGMVALELGSAPGGASLSLMQHGAGVIGVDAARMDRQVLEFSSAEGAKFTHFKMSAGQVPRGLLPARVDVLVCDLNAAPPVILPIVEKYQKALSASRFILTMKLGDAEMVGRIPEFMRRLRRFAPAPVRAVQLAANRSEFCVVAGGVG